MELGSVRLKLRLNIGLINEFYGLTLFEGDLELGTGSRGCVVLAVTVRQGLVYYEFGTRICELEYLSPYLVLTLILSEIHLINEF